MAAASHNDPRSNGLGGGTSRGSELDSGTLSVCDTPVPDAVNELACLVLALECHRPLSGSARLALEGLDLVVFGRGPDRSAQPGDEGAPRSIHVRVPDKRMSSSHAYLERVGHRWVLHDSESKNGTFLNGRRTTRAVLGDGDVFEMGHTFFVFREAGLRPGEARSGLVEDIPAPAPGLSTFSGSLARVFSRLAELARSEMGVVLLGETGTGKEVVARSVHILSGRSGEFVAVNCGAIPDDLIESELFGHKKGAFSGASDDRVGLVRASNRGTLFLDELGDLPAPSQAAFLRVLQEREVTPVGESKPQKVDLRTVVATHRDLDDLVRKEEFRADLLARVSGFTVRLPPLRARREDLGMLVATFLTRHAPEVGAGLTFSVKAARALFRYEWPLNIRELEKCVSAAAILAGEGKPKGAEREIELEHLPEPVQASLDDLTTASAPVPLENLSDEDVRLKEELVARLEAHKGNVSAVSREMGKARMQIHRWIQRYGLDLDSFRR